MLHPRRDVASAGPVLTPPTPPRCPIGVFRDGGKNIYPHPCGGMGVNEALLRVYVPEYLCVPPYPCP